MNPTLPESDWGILSSIHERPIRYIDPDAMAVRGMFMMLLISLFCPCSSRTMKFLSYRIDPLPPFAPPCPSTSLSRVSQPRSRLVIQCNHRIIDWGVVSGMEYLDQINPWSGVHTNFFKKKF